MKKRIFLKDNAYSIRSAIAHRLGNMKDFEPSDPEAEYWFTPEGCIIFSERKAADLNEWCTLLGYELHLGTEKEPYTTISKNGKTLKLSVHNGKLYAGEINDEGEIDALLYLFRFFKEESEKTKTSLAQKIRGKQLNVFIRLMPLES